jgi:glycosyltransferase involved in cell wall biosynthesis
MTRILFLIRSLDHGGAEGQLVELLEHLDKTRFDVTVATFYSGGALRARLEGLEGVRVVSLGKKGRWDVVPFLFRLRQAVRRARPDVVHGYMGVANELALVSGRLAGAKVVWGLRASYVDFSAYDWAARAAFRAGAKMSNFADLIIVNSWAGRDHHARAGYSAARMVVIPNGIDTEALQPDAKAGTAVRDGWGVPAGVPLVGLVGRLDPMKDHPTFLRAAAKLVENRAPVYFVCVGGGPASYREGLEALSRELRLGDRLIWAGERTDMCGVYNALDLVVMSSYGEGFPNVVGEAMACGLPCVVTDVGDAARLVGDTGVVVPPHDPEALARGMTAIIERPDRGGLAAEARRRIETEFSVARLATSTENVLLKLVA